MLETQVYFAYKLSIREKGNAARARQTCKLLTIGSWESCVDLSVFSKGLLS